MGSYKLVNQAEVEICGTHDYFLSHAHLKTPLAFLLFHVEVSAS